MDLVVEKLSRHAALSPTEIRVLKEAFDTRRVLEPGETLIAEREPPRFVGVLLEGMLRREKILSSGHRQILGLPLPGDVFDLHGFLLERMDHSIIAFPRSVVALAPHSAVLELNRDHPRLGALLWRDGLVENAIFREWIANCGHRPGPSRLAHLICEIYTRLAQVGLTDGLSFAFPLSQADLGDAIGQSAIHVNRTLQRLRGENLIRFIGGRMDILDWEALRAAAGFDPLYLHLVSTDRPTEALLPLEAV
jgi:CRP-like cAMP-binding protein